MIAKARVMIVEREAIVADDIENNLEKFGYAVSAVVLSGEEAVRKAGEDSPDLVLMEMLLSGEIDGIEAASRIAEEFNIPVVFITSVSDKTTIERAKKVKPYGFLIKPLDEDMLNATIEMAIYRHRNERQKQPEDNNEVVSKENRAIVKSTEAGLKAEWTRATFILKKEHLDKIKTQAYWERKKVKDVVEDAFDYYFENRKSNSGVR